MRREKYLSSLGTFSGQWYWAAGWTLTMKHVDEAIRALRKHIAASEDRESLEEVDSLLAVALEEVRRKLAAKLRAERTDRDD